MAPPNVLLVILDSVRARNASLYGYDRETTPFMESFAEDAKVYTQARAPGIHSVASHASIFSGHHVEEHRATDHASDLDPDATIWHELSTEHGYTTGLFSPNVIVTVTSNLADPFDTLDGPRRDDRDRYFQDVIAPTDIEGRQTKFEYLRACVASGAPLRAAVNGLFFLYHDRGEYDPTEEGADEYVDSFLEWSAETDGPWAACLNLMDAHYAYRPKEDFDLWADEDAHAIHDELSNPASREIATSGEWWRLEAIEPLYDGCIRQVDAAIETLVTRLRERGELDDTLLVITSDHGEGFGEHSQVNPSVRMADHGWGLHEVLTHVPLIVRASSNREAGFDDALASLTEFPSVVRGEIAGEPTSFAVDEYAIASTDRLEDPEAVLPAACEGRHQYAGPWRVVYEQRGDDVDKHVAWADERVIVRVENAQESTTRSEPDPDLVDEVYDSLHPANVRLDDGVARSLDDDVEQQLEELGYLR